MNIKRLHIPWESTHSENAPFEDTNFIIGLPTNQASAAEKTINAIITAMLIIFFCLSVSADSFFFKFSKACFHILFKSFPFIWVVYIVNGAKLTRNIVVTNNIIPRKPRFL